MILREKNSHFTSRLSNIQGQAVIEYVLMLVISVALIYGLASQIFKPINAFLDNYMGKYLECILEMGELPSLGSENTALEDEGCNARFEPGTLANGRPPKGSSSSGSGSSSSNKKSSSNSDRGGSGGSGGTYAGSSSRRGSSRLNSGRRPSGGVQSDAGAGNGKVVEIALDGGGSGSFFGGGAGGGSSVRRRSKTSAVAISGLTEAERKKLEKKADGEGRSVLVTGEGIKPPVKKTIVKAPPVVAPERPEEPFTIGNFIRIIFIAAIIIALVLFIGGQALQMSKSFEK